MAPPSPDLSVFNSTSSLLSLLDLNDDHRRHHHHRHHRHHLSIQNMENMDIDMVTVLDTPDRLSTQKINKGIDGVEDTRGLSVDGNSGVSDVFDKGVHNWVGRGRSNTDNPNNRRLFSRNRGDTRFHGETQENGKEVVDLVSPTPAKHANFSKRVMSENLSSHPHFTERVTSSSEREKLDGDNLSIAELVAGGKKMHGKNEEKRNDMTKCKNKEKMDDGFSILEMPPNTSCLGGRDLKKKTLREGNLSSDIDDRLCIGAATGADHGKGIHLNNGKLNTQSMSKPLQSTTLQRKHGQRRLVRNGCIAPHNTAKAKCNNESHEKSFEDGKQGVVEDMVSNFRASSSQMNMVTPASGSNDTERVKGKGIMVECSAQKNVDESSHLSSRISPNPTETIIVDTGKDAISTFGGMDGWRSTHNRSNSTSTLSGGAGQLARTNERAGCSHETSDVVLLQRGPTSSSVQAQPSSGYRSEVDKKGGRHCGPIQMARGQRKRGSTFSNAGESSTSVSDDSEILLLSSKEPINARSTRSRSGCHRGNLSAVIQIDDMSPGVQVGGSQNTSQTNDESNARARQLEADEALARELQEQFYHELPVAGSGEVDADIAWSLQHEEEAQRASLRRQRVHPRDASMAHLYRHNHAQALQDSSIRPTTRASRGRGRGPTSARMPRLRDRVLGNSSTTSSRGRGIHRSIQFRPNIDVEMRIHILEALEAAAGATEHTMPSSFFQLQRDFTEDDYEMLLALDENNHQHGGANPVQINGLPESKVQVGTVVEDCAVCLETPTIGDAIRHLPCLHKFHKECIDPWLRRKTSCPICKSGIT